MSVEFDPVRLGQRRRRVEPAVIGVVVMTVAIAAAIAKPWAPSATPPGPGESLAAISAADGSPAPTPSSAPTPRATAGPPDWTAVTDAVTSRDSWGVAAVLLVRQGSTGVAASPPTPRYLERWAPTATDASGSEIAYVDRGDRAVTALGVTVPAQVIARAVRIWRLHEGGALEWIDAARIDDQAASRAPLLIRLPLADGVAAAPWDAGEYRMDVLVAGGIHRISVFIPNRFGNVPPPDTWAAAETEVVAAEASDPSAIRVGLFATVNGSAVPIAARRSEPLGEVEAWAEVAVGGESTVAARHLPRATGLGVMLTPHAFVESATIRRLAPAPLVDAPKSFGGISAVHGSTPFVVFAAPKGGVWEPGVYALTVDWTDATGPHLETWHVELRPGLG